MKDENDKSRINLGYPIGQLLKAVSSTGKTAATRVQQWTQVIDGLLNDTLRVGSRAPVEGIPPWVTLEVIHGGFATGNFAAGGSLQPHEIEKLNAVRRPAKASKRSALNLHFLEDSGRSELLAMLGSGCFRVQLPEEGALLIAVWLMNHGEGERAEKLIETVMPFFDRLRFYPVPYPRPLRSGTGVYVQTVKDSVRSLRAKRASFSVAKMNEAIQVWTPMYDHAVALFLETVEGDLPALETTRGGVQTVTGGWPCRHYPRDWEVRADQFIDDYRQARTKHRLCKKPDKPKENFARLRGYLAKFARNPNSLTVRDTGAIRKILASYITRHGAPGSIRLENTRAEQARNA